jgi:hypothetical protein
MLVEITQAVEGITPPTARAAGEVRPACVFLT